MTAAAVPVAPTDAHGRFMAALTPEMRRQALMMAELLNQHSDHFIIFTARKTVCLADVLRRLGYWRGQGDFCSNRALDGDLAVLTDRDVLVMEDLAASCRTLHGAVQRARAAGARSVKCFALSVEGPREVWEKELGIEFLSPYLDSDIGDSIRHARSLVDAFAALPRPYNVDWPSHAYEESVSIDRAASAGWRALVGARSGGPVSLEPSDALLDALGSVLPARLFAVLEASHLSKVRLYPVNDPHPRGTHAFAVPVVALGAMGREEIRATLDELAAMIGALPAGEIDLRESYRLLQFALGDVMLSLFSRSLRVARPIASEGTANFLFLPPARDWALQAQEDIRHWSETLDWPPVLDARPVDFIGWDELEVATREREVADAFLADFFLERYVKSNEYRLRCELRAEKQPAERQRLAREIRELVRPADGASFTAGELRERLIDGCPHLNGFGDPRELVSVFLDRAIDAGEVVPDIDVVDGVVSRRFRPGEIISFEQDMQAQVEAMLRCYAANAEHGSFSADLVQKLVVGYVKYLLVRRPHLDESPGGPARHEVGRLQRRYHLRGAVLDEVAADFVARQATPEVAQILEGAGVLDAGVNGGYMLPPDPVLKQLIGDPMEPISFGWVMASIMRLRDDDTGKRQVDEDHLARLVTLGSPVEQALALSADMFIASKRLSGSRERDRQAIEGRAFVDGLNNGLAKASWIKDRRSEKLLRAVKKRLSLDNDLYAGAVESVMGALSPQSGESDARRFVAQISDWFACAHVWSACLKVASAPADKRVALLAKPLRNKAFLRLGGLKAKRYGAPVFGRLRDRLAADEVGWDAELDELLDDVATELLDLAQNLLERAYDLSARDQTTGVRRTPVLSCLLVRSDGNPCDGLAKIAGTGDLLRPGNARGESLLEPFDRLLPLRSSFDLVANGSALIAALRATGVQAVLVEAMPPRFRVFETPEQVAHVPSGFVELIETAGLRRYQDGELPVLLPASSASMTSQAVRASATRDMDQVVLGCKWERWNYPPPLQQLPLEPNTGSS